MKNIKMYQSIQEGQGQATAMTAKEELEELGITSESPPSKYHVRNIWKDQEWVDFYMLYDQYRLGKTHQVGDSAIEHAWKKITQAGERSGGKSRIEDLEEAIWSLQNAVKMIKEHYNG